MINLLTAGESFVVCFGQLVYDEGPFELMPSEILPDNLSPVSFKPSNKICLFHTLQPSLLELHYRFAGV